MKLPSKALIIFKYLMGTITLVSLGIICTKQPPFVLRETAEAMLYLILGGYFTFLVTLNKYNAKETNHSLLHTFLYLVSVLLSGLLLYSGGLNFSYELHWLCLVSWFALALTRLPEKLPVAKKAFYFISYLLTISATFIFIGTHVFSFSIDPLASATSVHFILDVRKLSAILLFITAFVYGAIKVKYEQESKQLELEAETENSDETLFQNIRHFLLFILTSFKSILFSIGKYLYSIGREIVSLTKDLFSDSVFMLLLIPIIFSSFGAIFFAKASSNLLYDYLNNGSYDMSTAIVLKLIPFFVIMITLAIVVHVFDSYDASGSKIIFKTNKFKLSVFRIIRELPFLVFSILTSGLILFGLSRMELLDGINSFYNVGLVTIALCIVVGIGILVGIFFLIFKGKKQRTFEQEADSQTTLEPSQKIQPKFKLSSGEIENETNKVE